MPKTITRKQFTEAIEAGLAATGSFDGPTEQAFRDLAATAQVTSIYHFAVDGAECPAIAVLGRINFGPIEGHIWRFIFAFDAAAAQYVPNAMASYEPVKVVD